MNYRFVKKHSFFRKMESVPLNAETKGPKETVSKGIRFTNYIKNLVDQELQFSKSIEYCGRTKEFSVSGFAAALKIPRRTKKYNFVSNFIVFFSFKKVVKVGTKKSRKGEL